MNAYQRMIEEIKKSGRVMSATYTHGPKRGMKVLRSADGRLIKAAGDESLTVDEREMADILSLSNGWEPSAAWCVSRGEESVYLEDLASRPRVFVLGCGHVARALYRVLSEMDFEIIMADERPEFAKPEDFPKAQVVCAPYEEVFPRFEESAADWYVIMTPGHEKDFVCAKNALTRRNTYVGMIGSRAKVATTHRRLKEAGISQEAIDDLHSPIGLSIGAQTPFEIAVSIAAQMIEVRRTRDVCLLEGAVESSLSEGASEDRVLATILWKRGSGPREQGTRMIISGNAPIVGTVGGGAIENAAILKAKKMLEDGSVFDTETYNMTSSGAATLGMICGGRTELMFERLEGAK